MQGRHRSTPAHRQPSRNRVLGLVGFVGSGRAVRLLGLVGLATAAVVSGCSGDDDGPRNESPLGLGDEGVGTCLFFDGDAGELVPSLPVIDCELSPTHQIYAIEEHPAEVYPGFTELEVYAQRVCLAAFEPFVGTNPFDSQLFHSWIVPTLDSWNATPSDREILCVLGAHDGAPLEGSMRDSRR